MLVPVERDRLDVAQKLAAAPPFPVEVLPPVMRGAVEALREHVQAPQPLCAHSIMSATMIVSQGLADIGIGPLGSATTLSLFMLVVPYSANAKARATTSRSSRCPSTRRRCARTTRTT